ncbi:uncharacterized protein PGTG_22435 [Puccinia graminis f. sp. tritici CRL 75-36-700-3]|uniref:Uncharacterized protein n=1 Tax=Puccinia graminis f. sp. tritici (strain CRL 75-36-700-3 / race SCCL) TaxID=418459 RepID=H6QUK5_PUCGT|nr:uncharacterized protein PGTG_22435 [Puccinia graminis f. sp. tritici CRL 75-36-700-3]EHS64717.1 hypothetical protein PGTG_22435 [Puccinia graminis f. sp. tritici CRL 75-36-700-3]
MWLHSSKVCTSGGRSRIALRLYHPKCATLPATICEKTGDNHVFTLDRQRAWRHLLARPNHTLVKLRPAGHFDLVDEFQIGLVQGSPVSIGYQLVLERNALLRVTLPGAVLWLLRRDYQPRFVNRDDGEIGEVHRERRTCKVAPPVSQWTGIPRVLAETALTVEEFFCARPFIRGSLRGITWTQLAIKWALNGKLPFRLPEGSNSVQSFQ